MKEPPFTHVQKPPVIKYFALHQYDISPFNVGVGDTPEDAIEDYLKNFDGDLEEMIVYGATCKCENIAVRYTVEFS